MAEQGAGCMKKGCLGCLALVAIGVVILAVLVAIGVAQATRDPEPRSIDDAQAIPAVAVPTVASPTAGDAAGPPIVAPIDVAEPGRIVLDVGTLDFRIVPAPAGSALRVDGEIDAARIELEQRYEPQGELGWTYTLSASSKGLFPVFVGGDAPPNRLTLHVPRDAPLALTGSVGVGASHLELGGLWLLDVDLRLGSGEHHLSFAEPLLAPLARFELQGAYGEFSVEQLGNASPVEARMTHKAGEVRIDLGGAWRGDGDVSVRCGFGECGVRLPRDVRVDVDAPRLMFGESSVRKPPAPRGDPPSLPLVRVAVSASAGELRVD